MAILNFTLSPEGLSKLHDALVCLGKFSEAVAIEATHDKVCHILPSLKYSLMVFQLVLTALNSSKSAYASFTLIGSQFFSKYHYKGVNGPGKEKFNCKIYNKVCDLKLSSISS